MYQRGLGQWALPKLYYRGLVGSPGLGQAEEPDCPEPVSTAERDAIVAALNQQFAGHLVWAQHHWAEGHPDLNAVIEDMWERVDGLKNQPKRLRCNANARAKAKMAIAEIQALLQKIKRGGATIIEGPGFWFKSAAFPPMRPYFIRGPYPGWGGGPKPPARGPEQYAGGGEVVTPPAPAAPPKPAQPGAPAPPPKAVEDLVATLTEGEIAGIPKKYIVYGVAGLVALNFLRRR